jgi:hypothetical protein
MKNEFAQMIVEYSVAGLLVVALLAAILWLWVAVEDVFF